MIVSAAHQQTLRQNAPLFGVIGVLVLAFAMLALLARNEAPRQSGMPNVGERVRPAPDAASLDALPGTADDDRVIASQLAPADAQARNAAVPLAGGVLPPARSFAFAGNGADLDRARECLALAGIAEAGAGDGDQRAVMQVILNRVRHPAFAKTVCGVVFQGSERATGCQFSFTCDGSLARNYPDSLWRAARQRAEEALGGRVYAPVGNATHFHADYVYPWWSSQLDKIAAVGPHLFFRWRGFWGTPQALSARYRGGEPDPFALKQTAEAVERPADLLPSFLENGAAVRTITAPPAALTPAPEANGAAPGSPAPGVHFVLVGASDAPTALIERARALCPGSRYCQVYGWSEAADIPAQLPLDDAARGQLRFSFLAPRDGNAEVAYFDCRLYPSPASGTCLPRARP